MKAVVDKACVFCGAVEPGGSHDCTADWVEVPPPRYTDEEKRAIDAQLAALRCETCQSGDVVCIDDGGGTEELGDFYAHLAVSAWQCRACGTLMGLSFGGGDDGDDDEEA